MSNATLGPRFGCRGANEAKPAMEFSCFLQTGGSWRLRIEGGFSAQANELKKERITS